MLPLKENQRKRSKMTCDLKMIGFQWMKNLVLIIREKAAHSSALVLESIGDIPEAEVKPPDNVLFICNLNPVTKMYNTQSVSKLWSQFRQKDSQKGKGNGCFKCGSTDHVAKDCVGDNESSKFIVKSPRERILMTGMKGRRFEEEVLMIMVKAKDAIEMKVTLRTRQISTLVEVSLGKRRGSISREKKHRERKERDSREEEEVRRRRCREDMRDRERRVESRRDRDDGHRSHRDYKEYE